MKNKRITPGEILRILTDKMLIEERIKQKYKNPTPEIGPRLQLIHYIFDLNWDLEEAVEKILQKFTSLRRENVLQWYYDEKNKRERGISNEGR